MPDNSDPGVNCTNCGSRDVQLSRKRTALLDSFMRLFDKRAYRCHACRRRFYSKAKVQEFEGYEAEEAAAPEPSAKGDAGDGVPPDEPGADDAPPVVDPPRARKEAAATQEQPSAIVDTKAPETPAGPSRDAVVDRVSRIIETTRKTHAGAISSRPYDAH
jgi:DNA-directed RNA polymerase subunit RPC12/RpoP